MNYLGFIHSHTNYYIHFFILTRRFVYWFEREGKGEQEREIKINVREKHWSVASCTHPTWESNLQPKYVLWTESNLQRFVYGTMLQKNWDTQPRLFFLFKSISCPGWCSSVDWAWAWKPKGCQFDSQPGHMPGLQARFPSRGCVRGNHTLMFLSLSLPSL